MLVGQDHNGHVSQKTGLPLGGYHKDHRLESNLDYYEAISDQSLRILTLYFESSCFSNSSQNVLSKIQQKKRVGAFL